MPYNMDPAVKACFDFVKNARHRTLTREERLDIVRLHAYFKSDGQKEVAKKVAQALGRSLDVVKDVMREYTHFGTVTAAVPAGNRSNHKNRIPHTAEVIQLVQEFVRDRRATRTRTTAVDVMGFLVEHEIIQVDLNNKTQEESAIRTVQRFLSKQGYKRGSRKGSSTYHLSKKNAIARDVYVQLMHPTNSPASTQAVVYTDESYIHHHYKCHNDSLYDPNDSLDKAPKEKHKGRRYCFIAAILDAPTVDCQLMGLDIFTGGKSTAKEPKDYHGMFNHEYYVTWFGKLLNELDALHVVNAWIVMDNAKYHKGLPSDTPSSRMRKQRLQDECKRFGIAFEQGDFKSVLWQKLSAYIHVHVKPVVVSMAEARGHKVVYTPPHHSDLQPIELVWAIVKGQAGRRYQDISKFHEVKARIQQAFADLTPYKIKGCIKVAQGKLEQLHKHLLQVDALSSDEESSAADSDDESENDNED
ncbi:hypothetical protein DYB35_001234 [Aphanomyces astaci]|uniref:Tc1-like transposase DDE domain-containing protein n=1 Tax=Aphanomyces astaci TaxID=112090 RepID=A0A3R7EAT8_APHAT|nr:hypothetical protein DYB35_001234 [Aphanomyces astaci]RQM29467.1 hypothetical protein B5M09_013028 [Aphanomyces astaci]